MRPAERRRRLPRRVERRRARPRLRHAVALGLLQGPTELLPVSSSGHTALVPWLAGWSYAELDPELRKAFEVALHAGAGAALALAMRAELVASARMLDTRRAAVIALSLTPPVLAGYALERPIERRLGGPRSIALGLAGGAVMMALADALPGRMGSARRPRPSASVDADGPGADNPGADAQAGAGGREDPEPGTEGGGASVSGAAHTPGERREHEATACDGLALGLAQAAALMPGVSRNGATLTAARARGFAREDAQTLSWHAALPVIVGAAALKGWRLLRGGAPDESRAALAVGAVSAFASTGLSARVLRGPRWRARAALPYAAYRCTIAAIALGRARRSHTGRRM